MATTASQKIGALLMPLGAFLLAWATSGPEWNPPRTQGSWREVMHPERGPAGKGKAPEAPLPGEGAPGAGTGAAPGAGGGAVPAPPEAGKEPAPTPAGKSPPESSAAKPPAEKAPEKPPEPPKEPEGLEFKVSGLATAVNTVPLRVPAGMRLDIHVLTTGAVRLGPTVTDPEMAHGEIKGSPREKKDDGLLFLIPQSRANWDDVLALAAAGVKAGWSKIGLCVGAPENAGQGRVLLLDVPSTEAPTVKGLDVLTVKVKPGMGPTPSFTFNGEDLANPGALRAKATTLHAEYEEGFEEGYSADPDQTPWTVDGAGASAGGVVAALDALRDAGVKTIRVAGLRRGGAEEGK
ncbi:MAG: hypothetical protein L6R43_01735 [Planctomycetes bacterium]|nr:hypothetical protein [Planctomycetota bacterium]